MDNSTYSFFEMFEDDNFCLLYDGNIVDDITDKIIDISEFNFEHQEEFAQSRKKVSFLLAECFQNIIRHSGHKQASGNSNREFGFFLTRNIYGVYFITSGNLIKNENVADLKTQLNTINSLEKEELKALYRDVLANKGFSQKGGAGLGLIEIARKSEQPIEYVFDDYNENYSIFYSQIMLRPPKQIMEHAGYHIIEAIQSHRKMISDNIIMIQKGDFSKSALAPVLEILQKNLSDFFQQTHTRKEVYHVLVEMLQNISRNGLEQDGRKDGIFIIKKKENEFIISAGNLVLEIQKNNLDKQIKQLNEFGKKEIKTVYLNSLEKENEDLQIELLDIARRCKGNLHYNFNLIKKGKYFFTLSVTV
jgi:hypothetical protein